MSSTLKEDKLVPKKSARATKKNLSRGRKRRHERMSERKVSSGELGKS